METNSRLLFIFAIYVCYLFMLEQSKWSGAWFHHTSIALKLAYNINKLYTIDPEKCSILIF